MPVGTGHHPGYQIFSAEPAHIRRTGFLAARTGTASTVRYVGFVAATIQTAPRPTMEPSGFCQAA